ncbi:DUF4434 domain-containing protein [uncultured Capnocytophaga sp.]|uniref:DUF4434 domain-containing protein n=1 Tax=uncultured Capnocytophaga sp. TaxID=159273 RepID=UPI00262D1F0F|nr:DUF4434 domain-containing protein [uncultured Capnocytophaga sp.]
MKKILLFILFSIFSLIACKKENNEEIVCVYPPQLNPKALTGTFLQLFGKDNWSEAQWDEFLTEIKDVGMNTLIVQYTAFKNPYNNITWFNSANTFTATKSKNTLQRLLASAGRKAIEVHIGLHFDDTYWQHQTDVAWLQTQANYCIAIAEEIQAQFGRHTAFKGWYIPHEPEPNAYNTDEKVRLFREHFVDRISNRLHQLNNKPVSIAAFWNSSLSTPEQMKHFMAELSKSNLQIIMLQDGVGAQHVTLNRLANYYEAAQRGLFEENKNYKGVFWSDLETFASPNGEYPFHPATFDRVKQQLETALSIKKVSKVVSFHYFDDMSTKSPHKAKADALREAYKNYIK